jgi:hypothetical protein
MGIFYYVKSIALSEDLPGVDREGGFESPEEFLRIADRGYVQVCTCVKLIVCITVLCQSQALYSRWC